MTFKSLFESTNIIVISKDMLDYADEAYEKVKDWLRLQKIEGYSSEHIFTNLLEKEDIFKRKIYHEIYSNPKEIIFTIASKPERALIRFDGGFDSGSMDRVTAYFVSPKQIDSFSSTPIKKDFIDRIRHEILHAIDPINNDKVIRKELEVDSKMQDQLKNGDYKTYIRLPWEKKANISSMAERVIEDLISKGLEYTKIKKEIENWIPKPSHANFQKEMDYFENDEDWRDYKEFMKKLLDIRIRSKK